ncbi:hypothetical protein BD309DRAFT_960438 [Dichomitus squalens]|nr:hypothetical protein BD309DRAFT_960438 [Dichomitus squalens]
MHGEERKGGQRFSSRMMQAKRFDGIGHDIRKHLSAVPVHCARSAPTSASSFGDNCQRRYIPYSSESEGAKGSSQQAQQPKALVRSKPSFMACESSSLVVPWLGWARSTPGFFRPSSGCCCRLAILRLSRHACALTSLGEELILLSFPHTVVRSCEAFTVRSRHKRIGDAAAQWCQIVLAGRSVVSETPVADMLHSPRPSRWTRSRKNVVPLANCASSHQRRRYMLLTFGRPCVRKPSLRPFD